MFIITNIATRPLFASPTSQPCAASKFITQVAEPWMPILCSIEPQRTPLRSPVLPSASTRSFGTMNMLMPLLPAGASGSRASTRCTMLPAMSCSPAVMKILVPLIEWEPSPFGTALVFSRPRSVPQCGSVRHMVPVHSPLTRRLRNTSFCHASP